MLKNNEERKKYIHVENNWDVLACDIVISECSTKESEKELHGGLIIGIPEIRLKRLKGTSIYKIEYLARSYSGQHVWVSLRVFSSSGNSLSNNQLVKYLRENHV